MNCRVELPTCDKLDVRPQCMHGDVACRGHWPVATPLGTNSAQFIDWGTVVKLPGRLPDQFLKVWRSFVWLVVWLGQYGRPCQQQLGFLLKIVQPFPRVEYSEEHTHMSLKDLHLVPNGSLVVKALSGLQPSGQHMLNCSSLLIPYSHCIIILFLHVSRLKGFLMNCGNVVNVHIICCCSPDSLKISLLIVSVSSMSSF